MQEFFTHVVEAGALVACGYFAIRGVLWCVAWIVAKAYYSWR